ncbi:MAG: ribonuclease Z [Thermoflavifilum sp.]|nr:ribonuclease Z [Thermoflavifilum sp.]MCL6514886.1 ribonuclease Z [Alicyclobacillus sp.]
MRAVFLGTSAGLPTTERNVTSIVLDLTAERGKLWMFDCGEGTQHQVLRMPVKLSRLEFIFITHLHGDHAFGLPGLLSTRSFQAPGVPLHIFGPPGVARWVHTALEVSGSHLSYPLDVTEITEAGEVFSDAQFRIECAWLVHPLPCLGYRITEADGPGSLKADALHALGIPPGPLYSRLKQGESVTLPDGRVIHGADFLEPPRPGRIVTILGDTAPCNEAVHLATGADLLVHEATFAAAEAESAHAFGHSTSVGAADTARRAGARRLVLTHISARYSGDGWRQLLDEARTVWPDTELAHDGTIIEVPRRNAPIS